MRRYLWTVAAALVLCVSGTGRATAAGGDLTTFADWDEAFGGNGFKFDETLSNNQLFVTGSLPVTFNYEVANGYNGTNFNSSPIQANMTFSATIAAPAGSFNNPATGALTDYENFTNVHMTFTADQPVGGNTDLLTLSGGSNGGATGTLSGTNGAATATMTGDTIVNGQSVDFSSDFLAFTPTGQSIPGGGTTSQSYTMSFTSLLNLETPQGYLLLNPSTGFLQSFNASGSGNFAANPAPTPFGGPSGGGNTPEPGTLALFLSLGCTGAFGLLRRRRAR